ncbi:SGNH/GDSL hydrolase family protein [Streptomyces alanosinicus]|uniref:Lipase 1 n=1 Tax=Streptomyces alanosinicus TaxID=68171 RepID=A0A918YDM8_9ACTN|nr:SGNH/GDSL hydrolase family protein [Streptomyces alanosinicus]GHD98985.1 lipase 1 [Streptomyces alanosinicus]
MRHSRIVACSSSLLLATACLSAAPTTVEGAPLTAAMRYVALGDSYSAGVGAGDYLPGRTACKRSSRAYPVLWAEAHGASSFAFPACNGAQADDVRSGQLGPLGPRTRLVTLTVGGSDSGFASVMATCALGGTSLCLSAVDRARSTVDRSLVHALDRLYSAIRDRAPAARVVVLGYPRFYHLSGGCQVGLQDRARAAVNDGVDHLDTVIARLAAAHGFTFADVRPAFAGHEICSRSPWMRGVDIPIVTESYHPTAPGQAHGYLAALDRVT